jgi:hypothetical protein
MRWCLAFIASFLIAGLTLRFTDVPAYARAEQIELMFLLAGLFALYPLQCAIRRWVR